MPVSSALHTEGRPDHPEIRVQFGNLLRPHHFGDRRDRVDLAVRASHLPTPVVAEQDLTQVLEHGRSEEHTSELQSLMRISYAVFCLKKKNMKTMTDKQKELQNKPK